MKWIDRMKNCSWIQPTLIDDIVEMNKRRAKIIDEIERKQYPELLKEKDNEKIIKSNI